MEQTKVAKETLLKIKEYIEDIRFGTVTIVVQNGKIVQIEKNEKIRLTN